MAEKIVSTRDLAVGYKNRIVVDGMDVSVERGKIVSIIGPNGAGKSTFLKTLAKQLETIKGTVFLKDKALDQMRESELARSLSFMQTGRVQTEYMTCFDMVSTGRYPYTGKFGILSARDREIVRTAMERVHAQELADVDYGCISDGQRQRVMLARAICQEPKILVLDEPTSYLDISYKLEILDIIRDLARNKGIAILMSLHELDLAEKISDEVICISGSGKVDRQGSPEDIFRDGYIAKLFEIKKGTYNEILGNVELSAVCGKPKVFVIAGEGLGTPVFRRLNRAGIPFAVGVLHENDMDYPAAKALAEQVITEEAFEEISEQAYREALAVMKACERVICVPKRFHAMNQKNQKLYQIALELGLCQK